MLFSSSSFISLGSTVLVNSYYCLWFPTNVVVTVLKIPLLKDYTTAVRIPCNYFAANVPLQAPQVPLIKPCINPESASPKAHYNQPNPKNAHVIMI